MASTTVGNVRGVLSKNFYEFDTVEQWNSYTKRRRDFCNFADVLAYGPFEPLSLTRPGTLAIQTCTLGTLSSHLDKLTTGEIGLRVYRWLQANNRCEIWGWAKRSRKRQGKPPIYSPTIRRLVINAHNPDDPEIYYYENSEVRWLPGQ